MKIHHFFIPHISNNFRAKLLHHQVLSVFILGLFLGGFLLSYISSAFPQVLGQAIDISVANLVSLTNEKRRENGERPLNLDEKLSKAASLKASDMFAKNYWAHNSPDGKTPWIFIKDSGYSYVYAGENLARGFKNVEEIVDAWMASESHRNNLLSENYDDIGFAVKKGRLNGEETVLIVQMFGSTTLAEGRSAVAQVPETSSLALVKSEGIQSKPIIDKRIFSSTFSRIVAILFISVLFIDLVIVERRKILRFVGHNIDHIFFLILILLMLGILSKGIIL